MNKKRFKGRLLWAITAVSYFMCLYGEMRTLADDFSFGRRNVTVSSNVLVHESENNNRECMEMPDNVKWYIEDGILYIKNLNGCKTSLLFERFYDCPWNEHTYYKVRVDAKIGVKLWYFDIGKARKCGKI